MNIRQLETLYWAVRLGSFNAAAERLNSTQSTVSMRIQELEKQIGIELFDRSQRTARVTSKGRDMARYAEEILSLLTEMRERIAAPETVPGLVRLGVAEVISATWLPELLGRLREHYPKVSVELEEALTQDLVDGLIGGNLDVILIAGRVPGAEMANVPLGSIEVAWVASPEIALPEHPLEAHDLAKFPAIALSRESHHYEQIENWFLAGGARFRRPFTCKSMGVCMQLASAGLGVTLVPPELYPHPFENGRLRILDTRPRMAPVEFHAVYRRQGLQPAAPIICDLAQRISTFDKSGSSAG